MKYDAAIFDLDGTLIDTNGVIIETFKHVLKKEQNIDLSDEEIIRFFGEPLLMTMERYDRANAQYLCKAYIEYNETVHDNMVHAMEGARDTILELKKRGIKTGVVSSKRRPMVDRGLNVCGLSGLVDVIITPEDTEKHKPDGEPILKACDILGVNPGRAIMVGDSHFDIQCGRNAGAKTCLVKYTVIPIQNIIKHKPEFIIDKLLEIFKIIDDFEADNVKICNSVS
jgi:pyrophosphatase PpaX